MTSKRVAQPVDLTREIYGDQFPLINRYVDILSKTGVAWGLLGPREADRLWDRHILNSAALSQLIAVDSVVADVGSGAGLIFKGTGFYITDYKNKGSGKKEGGGETKPAEAKPAADSKPASSSGGTSGSGGKSSPDSGKK